MKIGIASLGVITCAMLSGCVTAPIPMNADEFRAVFNKESSYAEKESYDVSVPFDKVASHFAKLGPKCFDVTVKSTSSYSTGRVENHYFYYKSTVIKHPSKAELHVQSYHEGDEVFLKMPKDGIYTVVADVTKVNRSVTHVELYYAKPNGITIAQAVKGWTHNTNLGCPDLTK